VAVGPTLTGAIGCGGVPLLFDKVIEGAPINFDHAC
jgi:hypothetical protein